MARDPVVSVALPARNCGPLLKEAVESVLGQTFLDLELLVVDDHSTDGSIESLPGDDPRLLVLKNPGAGLVDALNFAAGAARGAYIARMDGDDISRPERIARQVRFMENREDVGICGTLVEKFSAGGVGEGYRLYEKWVNSLVTPESIRRAIFIESPMPHPSVMIRRAAFEALGGYRDMGWPEDYDLWLRAFEAGVVMAKVPETLLEWRDSPGRFSRTDPRYSREGFMKARAHFLKRTVLKDAPAVIWGAGGTGALLARHLKREGARVSCFIDINPRKIGGVKAGRPVRSPEAAKRVIGPILAAVAARGAREEIRAFLAGFGKREGVDFFMTA
ncbi:MAG: glycosyltransferase [Candidatus Nitrospinota bacterium M3_3B_026]